MKEIRLEILPHHIEQAKAEQAKFDAQKTHDKFSCNTNYIGYLGELIFNEYLKTKGIDYSWNTFTKQGWDEPDFIINGKTIDLKTTFSDVMWIQKEKFDYYIYAQINKNQTLLKIKGWLSKQEITEAKYNGNARVVVRKGRKDFIFEPHFMNSMEALI